MALLVIDTTGGDCSVALRVAGQADRVCSDPIGRGHAEYLAPMVGRLLDEAGLPPSGLRRIGVATGPGSFAGSRVGVAFARGLALATGAEAVGIGNLAILAQAGGDRPVAAVHDARRGEVILQVWVDGIGSSAERLSPEAATRRIPALAGAAGVLVGTGAGLIALEGFTDLAITGIDPLALLDLAERADAVAAPPSPFYARPPDAKLPGGLAP